MKNTTVVDLARRAQRKLGIAVSDAEALIKSGINRERRRILSALVEECEAAAVTAKLRREAGNLAGAHEAEHRKQALLDFHPTVINSKRKPRREG